MLSIYKYLTEQRMDMDTIRHARKRFMLTKGIGTGTPVAGPTAIAAEPTAIEGSTTVAAPSVIKKTLTAVEGPKEIDANEWASKFGGAAKKAVQTAIENK
jgi:hypothetical protein